MLDMTAAEIEALRGRVRELARVARVEDLGSRGDITTELILPDAGDGEYSLVARQDGVLAGKAVVADILDTYDRRIEILWHDGVEDGVQFASGLQLARLAGPGQSVLCAERVLLNFLQRLCGVASATHRYVEAVAGTEAKIYDTRKTIPGWRLLDKYAVRCGGGRNHRMGLYDAVLVKDNHRADVPPERLAGAIFEVLNDASALDPPPTFVEVEADDLDQVKQLFQVVGVDVVLLDNFSPDQLLEAVKLRDELGLRGKVKLEASGGITLDTVRAVAETGVDRISVGAMTHSAAAVDLALERD